MFLLRALPLCLSLSLILAACGDDQTDATSNKSNQSRKSGTIDTSKPINRAGAQGLAGPTWTFPTTMVNGMVFNSSYGFEPDRMLYNFSCEDPKLITTFFIDVDYTYKVDIAERLEKKTGDDNTGCTVVLNPFEKELQVVKDKLVVSDGTQTFTLSPAGNNAGLYGLWSTDVRGDTLNLTFGDGQVVTESVCANGLRAEVTAPATFTNYLQIDSNLSGGDASCYGYVNSTKFSYRILEDGRLELTNDEGTVVAEPREQP